MKTKMLLIYFFIVAIIACNGGGSGNKNYIEGVTAMTSHIEGVTAMTSYVELRLFESADDTEIYGDYTFGDELIKDIDKVVIDIALEEIRKLDRI